MPSFICRVALYKLMSSTKKDRKEEENTTVPSPSQIQKEQQYAVNKALDETKDEIKTTTKEAAKEIPKYTERLGDIQEETIQTTREIANNCVESHKQIINIYQSVWTPFIENANSRFWNYWWVSPKGLAEAYGNVASSFADNVISTTRLSNNAMSANMALFSTALQHTKHNSDELSRLCINAAKVINEASNDIASASFSMAETASPRLKR